MFINRNASSPQRWWPFAPPAGSAFPRSETYRRVAVILDPAPELLTDAINDIVLSCVRNRKACCQAPRVRWLGNFDGTLRVGQGLRGVHLLPVLFSGWDSERDCDGSCHSLRRTPSSAAETLSFAAPSCRPGRLQRLVRPGVVQRQRQARPRTQAPRREPQCATRRIPEQALDARPHVLRLQVRDQHLARVGDVLRVKGGSATARQRHDLP